MNSLEGGASTYAKQAVDILAGSDGMAAKDELARFAPKIHASAGVEQENELEKLVNALYIRKPSIFRDIPEEKHERVVFALALAKAYEDSLH